MYFSKRGVSEIVSTVLIVMIAIAAIGIIAAFLVPTIRNSLTEENLCSDAISDLYMRKDTGYSCFDQEKKIISTQITKGNSNVEYYGVKLKTFSESGETISTFSIASNFSLNEEKVFYLSEENDKIKRIELYPLIRVSKKVKECKSSSKVEFEKTACSINKNSIKEKGVYLPTKTKEDSILYKPTNNIINNLVGYWSFDFDSETTAFDLSKTKNHGNYTNGAYKNSSCSSGFGACAQFDGNDDYISLGITNLPTRNAERTASAWVYLNIYNPSSSYSHVFHYGGYWKAWGLAINNNGGLSANEWRSPDLYSYGFGKVNLTKWTHIAISLDSSGNKKFYIDGNLVGSENFPTETINSGLPRIGARLGISIQPNLVSQTFNGSIDEVMIFNKSLTEKEIQEIYKNQRLIKLFLDE